ncbi:nucleotidyltransferase family protein [Thalassococcus sp. CAU 1522]|uniref:Nucleotidyltransferase family protein n=2 Tax=Thalassococcus arenae TaxID=2851652 RepID=A0ABS6N670_9RHOB|nr:nucleotidyltransferase family protein [Thalassococcus arenae]MBV2359506.1 nucleotidyltransferase family protein [Thalassococcus arenae]
MLFAAGFGTRMRPLTDAIPKPLIPVAGRALLDHALALCATVPRKVVNAHYLADQIVAHLDGRGVSVSVEAPDILDTGGGLKTALPLLSANPVFTLNTDAIWDGPNPLDVLRDAWAGADADALLLCVPLARALGRSGGGDFSLDTEKRLKRGGELVYTGAQILRTDAVSAITDAAFSLNRVWDDIARSGRLRGVVYPGRWCDVGNPDGIALAEAVLRGDV